MDDKPNIQEYKGMYWNANSYIQCQIVAYEILVKYGAKAAYSQNLNTVCITDIIDRLEKDGVKVKE